MVSQPQSSLILLGFFALETFNIRFRHRLRSVIGVSDQRGNPMLQTSSSNNPPQIVRTRARRQRPTPSKLGIIDAKICPLGAERDLLDKLCYLKDANDVTATVALYDAYAASAESFASFLNEPRIGDAHEYLEDEFERAWAKAYLVGDFLKEMHPDEFNVDIYFGTLFKCAQQMGNNLTDVIGLMDELASEYSAMVERDV